MVRVFKQQLVLAGVAAALMARPEDPPSAPQGAAEHPEAAVPAHPNLIFASFAGLLQQWPNTFAYAGHSIVPGEVPRGTLLYHATTTTTTSAGRPPPAPDQGPMKWLAFDPEYSYVIHSRRTGLLDLHTYAAARALRILYLDGQSASLGSPGFMDSQDVLLNRTVAQNIQEPDYLDAEYHRARMLCQLGKRWGFEGVVRMNTCFELLWCDMSQGLQLLARTNITDPYDTHPEPTEEPDQSSAKLSGHPPPDPPVGQHPAPDTTSPVCPADLRVQHPFQRAPEGGQGRCRPDEMGAEARPGGAPDEGLLKLVRRARAIRSPFYHRAPQYYLRAASRKFFWPGEPGVVLDPGGFVSFYDGLGSLSLRREREGTADGPRHAHRLAGISADDARIIRVRVQQMLARKAAEGWRTPAGPDFRATVAGVVRTYAGPLRQLDDLLSRADIGALERVAEVRDLTHAILRPAVGSSSGDPGWRCGVPYV